MYSKKMRPLGVVFMALPVFFGLSRMASAQDSAIPGRSVGHVFLGMDRADVWKILHKPNKTYTVPHGMSLQTEDVWSSSEHTLSVISERGKIIQVEFDTPRITTSDGLSTQSTWSQVRRRHPSMTVRNYEGTEPDAEGGVFYIDDVRQGIAFTLETMEGVEPQDVNTLKPESIIIHRPGYRVLSINEGYRGENAPNDDPSDLRVIRAWFTPNKGR